MHNAVEAVHSDTGIIEIETNVDKSMVSILIKDNGEGISKKDLKNVASPFFTTKTKGTGLGLMLCKRGEIALTYIYGIGNSTARYILDKAVVSYDKKAFEWNDEEQTAIRNIINAELSDMMPIHLPSQICQLAMGFVATTCI